MYIIYVYNFKFLLKYAYIYTHYIYNNYTDERGWIHTKILSVVISEYWYACFPFCFSVFYIFLQILHII